MSTICVDFEVLPAPDDGSQLSAAQVYDTLKRQLHDKGSPLMSSDFGKYADNARLDVGDTGPLGPPPNMEDVVPPFSMSRGPTSESHFPPSVGGGTGHYDAPAWSQPPQASGSHFDAHSHGHHYDAGVRNLSDAELIDRISHMERQLSQRAAGTHGPSQDYAPRRSVEVEALEETCTQLRQRLEAIEPELREAQESARTFRAKVEQAELRLKDREQLLAHAKEMWMKENVRASKLADALTAAEDRLADQERRLQETMERYDRAQQEVRQLQHLLGGPSNGNSAGSLGFGNGAGGASGGFPQPYGGLQGIAANGTMKVPASTGSLPSRQLNLDSWGDDLTAAARPASSQNLAETNADRFRRLCQLNDAVLYEDELLQIGIKMEFIGREGQVAVYFGNKGGAALQAFTVQYYVQEDHALRLSASPLSQQLEANTQVVQRLNIQFVEPFVEAPWLRIQFLLPDASPRRIQTRFPIVITKFMQGLELSSSEFFRLWRLQNFVLNEATSIVHLAARFSGPLVHMARILVFGGSLRLHHGVDTDPENFVLVSRLVGGGSGSAMQRDHDRDRDRGYGEARDRDRRGTADDVDSSLSLIRVEVGRDRFLGKARVVVRSGNHATARALCDGIVAQLAEALAPPSSGGLTR